MLKQLQEGNKDYPSSLESVEKTEERVKSIDDHLRQINEMSDSSTESESEFKSECLNAKAPYVNAPNYSETITFCDGYKAKFVNSSLDHQLVKHGHSWKINDIYLKVTEEANKNPSEVG